MGPQLEPKVRHGGSRMMYWVTTAAPPRSGLSSGLRSLTRSTGPLDRPLASTPNWSDAAWSGSSWRLSVVQSAPQDWYDFIHPGVAILTPITTSAASFLETLTFQSSQMPQLSPTCNTSGASSLTVKRSPCSRYLERWRASSNLQTGSPCSSMATRSSARSSVLPMMMGLLVALDGEG
jgi:hypothetical protein